MGEPETVIYLKTELNVKEEFKTNDFLIQSLSIYHEKMNEGPFLFYEYDPRYLVAVARKTNASFEVTSFPETASYYQGAWGKVYAEKIRPAIRKFPVGSCVLFDVKRAKRVYPIDFTQSAIMDRGHPVFMIPSDVHCDRDELLSLTPLYIFRKRPIAPVEDLVALSAVNNFALFGTDLGKSKQTHQGRAAITVLSEAFKNRAFPEYLDRKLLDGIHRFLAYENNSTSYSNMVLSNYNGENTKKVLNKLYGNSDVLDAEFVSTEDDVEEGYWTDQYMQYILNTGWIYLSQLIDGGVERFLGRLGEVPLQVTQDIAFEEIAHAKIDRSKIIIKPTKPTLTVEYFSEILNTDTEYLEII